MDLIKQYGELAFSLDFYLQVTRHSDVYTAVLVLVQWFAGNTGCGRGWAA
jgi:hypothetical protein